MFLGEHASYFYDSIKRKHYILFSNLLYGVNHGCAALYITSSEKADAIKVELSNFGFKTDNPQKLKIVTSHQWYTPDGDFNARRVVDQYRSLIDNVIDHGFAGLYVSADASDTFDYLLKKGMIKEWMAYEDSLGVMFKFPMEAICAYRADQIVSNSQMFLELIEHHKSTFSLKPEKSVLNSQLIRSTVFHQFKEILGKTVTMLIFDYLDDYIMTQNLDTSDDENFWTLLRSILKEGNSALLAYIEQNIVKEICVRLEIQMEEIQKLASELANHSF